MPSHVKCDFCGKTVPNGTECFTEGDMRNDCNHRKAPSPPAQEPQSVASLVAELRNLKMFHTRFERALYEKAAALLEAFSKVPLTKPFHMTCVCIICDSIPPNHADECPVANLHKTLADLGMKLW